MKTSFTYTITGIYIISFLLYCCETQKQKTDLTAYDIYLIGKEHTQIYWDSLDREKLACAKCHYNEAIKQDPELAPGYIGLGWTYFDTFYWWSEEFLKKEYLDSVLILSDHAISIDPNLAEAWHLRGKYYGHSGNPEKAIEDVNRCIQLNPEDVSAYLTLGWIYCQLKQEYDTGFKYYQIARQLSDVEEWPPRFHNDIAYGYMNIGYYDKAIYHLHKAIRLQPDVMEPILLSSWLLEVQGKIDKKLAFIDSIQQMFPGSNACISELAYTYAGLGEFEKAEKYYAQVIDTLDKEERIPLKFAHRLGYVFWNLGQESRAQEYFESQLAYCRESLLSGEGYQTVEYDLAAVYAFLGEEKKALDYLSHYAEKGFTYGLHDYILRDPLFEKIRGNKEFQNIVQQAQEEKAALRELVLEMEELGDDM